MNKFFKGLAASLIIAGSAISSFAQETNSLLWKISGNDLAKPSYLFGTIHMLPADKYFFTDKMQSALDASDVLALEADIDIPLAEQMKMAADMIMPDGKTWKDYMTEEEYANLKSAFVDSLGIKEKKVDKYSKIRPIYVSGLIMTELLGKIKMYEKELSGMAQKAKKEIIGLETIQEQIKIVGDIPVEEQVEDLKTSTASMMRDYNAMLDAYTTQNLAELEKVSADHDSFETIEDKLLTDRNNRWIVSMKEMLPKNSTFFAVGAMHLIGETGLIKQLKAEGYTVEAVK
ncbi:MAG: TraB/GumN family protein [Flavobacteriales bacterium]